MTIVSNIDKVVDPKLEAYKNSFKVLTDFHEKMINKCCYNCNNFYEDVICGYELEYDNMKEIRENRKAVCTLDKVYDDILIYLEDSDGGFICKYEDKVHFTQIYNEATICFMGTKEEMETYLKTDIDEKNIMKVSVTQREGRFTR